jgi:hypothetical protein
MTEPAKQELSLPEVSLVGLPERFQPRNLTELMSWSRLVTSSALAPKGMNEAAVVLAVQMGAELNVTPTQALQNIAVINGRPSIFGDLGLAIFKRDAKYQSFEERSPDEALKQQAGFCRIVMNDGHAVERSFSVEDAKRAQLWGKQGPWTTYPGRMLMFRARWWAMRDAAPEVFKGLAGREEQQDVVDAEEVRVDGKLQVPRRRSEGVGADVEAFAKSVKPAVVGGQSGGAGPVPRSPLKKVMILSAAEKSGGGKTFYIIAAENSAGVKAEMATFSASDYAMANSLKGQFALISTKEVKKGEKTYINLTHIEAAPEEVEEAPPAQDEPGSAG